MILQNGNSREIADSSATILKRTKPSLSAPLPCQDYILSNDQSAAPPDVPPMRTTTSKVPKYPRIRSRVMSEKVGIRSKLQT